MDEEQKLTRLALEFPELSAQECSAALAAQNGNLLAAVAILDMHVSAVRCPGSSCSSFISTYASTRWWMTSDGRHGVVNIRMLKNIHPSLLQTAADLVGIGPCYKAGRADRPACKTPARRRSAQCKW
jgi:hypothetical protein